jgi:hypothetical protein
MNQNLSIFDITALKKSIEDDDIKQFCVFLLKLKTQ